MPHEPLYYLPKLKLLAMTVPSLGSAPKAAPRTRMSLYLAILVAERGCGMRKRVVARKLLRGWRPGMESSEGSGLWGISSLYQLTSKSLRRTQAVFSLVFFFNPPIWGRGPGRANAGTQIKF